MSHLRLALVSWSLLASAGLAQSTPAVPDVRGYAGPVLLDAAPTPDADSRRAALALAIAENPRVLLFGARDTNGWEGAHKVERALGSPVEAIVEQIGAADVVWIEGSMPGLAGLPEITQALKSVLDRKRLIGVSSSSFPLLGAPTKGEESLGLFPNALFLRPITERETPVRAMLAARPGTFAFAMAPSSRCLIQQRVVRALGESKAAVFQLDGKAMTSEKISGRLRIDWVQQSRIALTRIQTPYPPRKIVVPDTGKGTVISIGGGRVPRVLLDRFVTAAGGKDASFVIIPTAQGGNPAEGRNYMVSALRSVGVKDAVVIHARTPDEARRKPFLDALRRARGIWFGGGRQWRLVDAYLGTEAHEIMRRCLADGGVIAGSSAGATISGGYLVRGSPLRNTIMMAEGYERGLGFLEGVAIDQHFRQRRRFPDMTRVHERHPQLLGFGIDEGTAIVVRGTTMEVLGDGFVAVYDGTKTAGRDHRRLASGARYDLRSRQPLR